jgi:flagellar motility protein MotE (MotC chaperone)
MHIPDIIEVKELLNELKHKHLIDSWELPYENLLTRRSAAIFFVTPAGEETEDPIWNALAKYENFSFRPNVEKKLSDLRYRITFSQEEKEKNIQTAKEVTQTVQ